VRKLGPKQAAFLESMREHRYWHAFARWAWGSPSETRRLAEALTARGLVRRFECPSRGTVYVVAEPAAEHAWQIDICSPSRRGFCTCGWPFLGPLRRVRDDERHLKTYAEWKEHDRAERATARAPGIPQDSTRKP
jgi:hypothetical protein